MSGSTVPEKRPPLAARRAGQRVATQRGGDARQSFLAAGGGAGEAEAEQRCERRRSRAATGATRGAAVARIGYIRYREKGVGQYAHTFLYCLY